MCMKILRFLPLALYSISFICVCMSRLSQSATWHEPPPPSSRRAPPSAPARSGTRCSGTFGFLYLGRMLESAWRTIMPRRTPTMSSTFAALYSRSMPRTHQLAAGVSSSAILKSLAVLFLKLLPLTFFPRSVLGRGPRATSCRPLRHHLRGRNLTRRDWSASIRLIQVFPVVTSSLPFAPRPELWVLTEFASG